MYSEYLKMKIYIYDGSEGQNAQEIARLNIQTELKIWQPNTSFSVKREGYNLMIRWTGNPTVEVVKEITNKYCDPVSNIKSYGFAYNIFLERTR